MALSRHSVQHASVNWHSAAKAVRWNIRPLVDGSYRDSAATDSFRTHNPATEDPLSEASVGSAADIDEAVCLARARFESGTWADMPPSQRGEIMLKLADLLARRSSELALLDTLEMGKPITAAREDIESLAPALIRSWVGFADKLWGSSAPMMPGHMAFNVYEPRGVVGAITPWNFPLVNAVIKCVPALIAGNSVVLKPSELAPSSALRFGEMALEAGVPRGVLNVVPGLGVTVGTALASHPQVDLLTFTGSTMTGRKVMELAARSNGKPLLLECGGKSPQIVFSDVDDLEKIATATLQSALRNQGQVCSAHTRLVVHADIKEALLEKIIEGARGYVPGDPLDERTTFGPLASSAQRDRVKSFVERGVREGARLALEGTVQEQGGCYVSPTIFDKVERSMAIAQEEIFGPVLCVQQFRTEEEALSLANSTAYGLVATVWTRDMGKARRCARAIRAGSVSVRTSGPEGAESGCILSHEPQRASGFGAEFGIAGLQAYSTLKLVHFAGA